jgi:hypothetical protein
VAQLANGEKRSAAAPFGAGLTSRKVDLSVACQVIRHRFTADESHGWHCVGTFAELSKQKRVGVDADRLVLAFAGTEDQLAVAGGSRSARLELQQVAGFENAGDSMQYARAREIGTRAQRRVRVS